MNYGIYINIQLTYRYKNKYPYYIIYIYIYVQRGRDLRKFFSFQVFFAKPVKKIVT